MTVAKTAAKPDLEAAIVEIWDTAQNAEGTRAGMSDALDQIQDQCAEVVPDVEDRATGTDDDDEDETDDDETD